MDQTPKCQHKLKQEHDGKILVFRCTRRGCGVRHYTGCKQWRRMLVTHGTIKLGVPGSYQEGRKEWETKQCGTPLFSEEDRVRGTCRSCAEGWTHEHNMPADAPEADAPARAGE